MQTTDAVVCCVKQVNTSVSITQVEKALTELPNNPFFVLAKNIAFLSFQSSRFSITTLLLIVKVIKFHNFIPAPVLSTVRWDRKIGQKAESSKLRRVTTDGLPCRLSGKESACQCKRHRFDPWSGKIPCAKEQLSPRATTTELVF